MSLYDEIESCYPLVWKYGKAWEIPFHASLDEVREMLSENLSKHGCTPLLPGAGISESLQKAEGFLGIRYGMDNPYHPKPPAPGTQSRIESLIESLFNTLIGFGVALVSQLLVFPLVGIEVPISTNLEIGAWFTLISVLRSYAIRRWFNAGLHKAAVKIARNLIKK